MLSDGKRGQKEAATAGAQERSGEVSGSASGGNKRRRRLQSRVKRRDRADERRRIPERNGRTEAVAASPPRPHNGGGVGDKGAEAAAIVGCYRQHSPPPP